MKKFTFLLFFAFIFSGIQAQSNETAANANAPIVVADCCTPPNTVLNIPVSNAIVFNGDNTLTLSQPISISTSPAKTITSITAELTYFEFTPGSDDCLTCNKNSATFGNFSKGTIAAIAAIGAGTHAMTSTFSPPKPNGSFPVSLTITLPPMVKCCDGLVKWCVRYVISFSDCTVCTKVICYQKKKAGSTAVVNPQLNNLN